MNNIHPALIPFVARARVIGMAATAYQMRAAGLPVSAAMTVLRAVSR
jgi:folate-dependent phosphoribosylglycinamide formyltransferase PurN